MLEKAIRSDFRFFHPLRVRWAEVDAQGIVFNAQYFFLFDVGTTEFFRLTGTVDRFGNGSTDIFTVSAQADFHGSARFDEEIEIGVRAMRLGTSSLTMQLGIWRGTDHLTTGQMIYVHADVASRTAQPLPEGFRHAIEAVTG